VGATLETDLAQSLDQVGTLLDADCVQDRVRLLRAMSQELGTSRDQVLDLVRQRADLSQKLADDAYALAEEHEPNPRSIWGFVQGLTRLSQRTPWQDGRFALDRAASRLLTLVV
jgi:hypothetical protein